MTNWEDEITLETVRNNPEKNRVEGNGTTMEEEWLVVRKAMAYDIFQIIDAEPTKGTYTPEEIKRLIEAYIVDIERKYSDK